MPPPAPPPSKTSQQGGERGNDSSEPNSPQPDDSFSSREEQQPEEGREVFLPSGGGQLCTECAPREEREEQREGEGEVDELLDLHMRMMTSVKTDVSLCFPSFLVSSSLLPPPPSFLVFLLSPPSSLLPPPSSLPPSSLLPSSLLPPPSPPLSRYDVAGPPSELSPWWWHDASNDAHSEQGPLLRRPAQQSPASPWRGAQKTAAPTTGVLLLKR